MSPHDDRSLGELLAELSRETGLLVRKEVELATTEMTSKVRNATAHVATIAAGGALAHAGVLVLLAALVIALPPLGVTAWLAAAIVGFGTTGVGYLLINKGMTALRRTNVVPTHAIQSLKEDAKWTTRQGA
jgi:Putative Actinobacterial Holin-X, holin superfamily III